MIPTVVAVIAACLFLAGAVTIILDYGLNWAPFVVNVAVLMTILGALGAFIGAGYLTDVLL